MYISAVVVAAGKGLRLRSKTSKPLVGIKSKPLIIYSLEVLSGHPLIKEIIVVVNPQNSQEIIDKIKRYKIDKIKNVVLGGVKRRDSVYNGLKVVNQRADMVLIHDAARPFIDDKILNAAVMQAKRCGAAIAGVPVKNTIKLVHGFRHKTWRTSLRPAQSDIHRTGFVVKKTLDREKLWEIQTPQVFKKKILLEAYEKFGGEEVTDDAMLVEKMGVNVAIVLGSYDNIKITTPEDLAVAEAILKFRNKR